MDFWAIDDFIPGVIDFRDKLIRKALQATMEIESRRD